LHGRARVPSAPRRSIQASANLAAKLVKNGKLKVYPGAPHGLATTHKELNADLLAFLKS
jgi:non-heme chloroperoxidase